MTDRKQETPEEVDARLLAEGQARGESEACAMGSCAMCFEASDCSCVCHG